MIGRRRTYSHDQILNLAAQGRTNQEIANVLGCTTDTVKYVKRVNGVTRPRWKPSETRTRYAWELERVR